MRKLSLFALFILCASALAAITRAPAAAGPVITPVTGPSNFRRIGEAFDSSDMGRTGEWGPSPEAYVPPPGNFELGLAMPATVTLSGADIYNLSCRGCHKADGNGSPPEIPSVIGPVQATSAAFMQQLMQQRGRPITAAFAHSLSSGSMTDLMNRLTNGGQKMPSFGYLDSAELNALMTYLYAMGNVPGAGKVATVSEPSARVGELLVKGTCHICHNAAGTWPSPEGLMQGVIPPMSGFTSQKTLPQFIWKVRHGAPVIMGTLELEYRGRMPVFSYLTDDEVADAYSYLIQYPPQRAPSPVVTRTAR